MNAAGFLPRSDSKLVFVVAVASYAFAAGSLIRAIATALGAERTSVGVLAEHGYPAIQVLSLLLLSPVIESLLLIGLIELLRWLRLPDWAQVACSAAIVAALHAVRSSSLAFVVAPGWAVMAASYLIWRHVSWKVAFGIVTAIHALLNLFPAIEIIGYALRST
jgi:hypothetical protein